MVGQSSSMRPLFYCKQKKGSKNKNNPSYIFLRLSQHISCPMDQKRRKLPREVENKSRKPFFLAGMPVEKNSDISKHEGKVSRDTAHH
jgi:hypothetical protein